MKVEEVCLAHNVSEMIVWWRSKGLQISKNCLCLRRSYGSVTSTPASSAAEKAPTGKRSAERQSKSKSKNGEEAGGNVASY